MRHENEIKTINQNIEKIFEDLYETFKLLSAEDADEAEEFKRFILIKHKVMSITNNILLTYVEHVKIKYSELIESKKTSYNCITLEDNHEDVINLLNKT